MEYSAINDKRKAYDVENNTFQIQDNIESNSGNLKRNINIKSKENYNKFISFNNQNELSYDVEGKFNLI